jgi:hypothetical protein
MKRLAALWILIMLLGGCTGGAVVFAPTPLPPDISPLRYEHPSGAFVVLLPRNWSVFSQQVTVFAAASFAAPQQETPLVRVAVVNLGREIGLDEVGDLMTQYQTQFRPDLARYTEQDRQAMGDGSWRISGLQTSVSGETRQVNTFIVRQGTLLGVIEIVLPADAALRSQLQTIVNTFSLGTEADLPVSQLSVLSSSAPMQIEVVNLSTWTTPEGVFFVTGEVANHSPDTLTGVPVRVTLLSETGEVLGDGLDTIMGYALESGGFAPFGIRFGQGQSPDATQYAVTLGGETYVPQTITIVSAPQLVWTDSTQQTADGDLFIVGTVQNTGNEAVRQPRAIVTLFDERGRVIGAGFADADDTILPAGETLGFTVLISDMGGVAANYVVNLQAYPCDASCE